MVNQYWLGLGSGCAVGDRMLVTRCASQVVPAGDQQVGQDTLEHRFAWGHHGSLVTCAQRQRGAGSLAGRGGPDSRVQGKVPGPRDVGASHFGCPSPYQGGGHQGTCSGWAPAQAQAPGSSQVQAPGAPGSETRPENSNATLRAVDVRAP